MKEQNIISINLVHMQYSELFFNSVYFRLIISINFYEVTNFTNNLNLGLYYLRVLNKKLYECFSKINKIKIKYYIYENTN